LSSGNFPNPGGNRRTKQGVAKIINKLGVRIYYFGNLALIVSGRSAGKIKDGSGSLRHTAATKCT
jgi:hypothetical protein